MEIVRIFFAGLLSADVSVLVTDHAFACSAFVGVPAKRQCEQQKEDDRNDLHS